jgi:hypothetical protein
MRLTQKQKEFLPAIRWLISDTLHDRATGRSLLLAYAFIQEAMKNSGRNIPIWNHHPEFQSRVTMSRIIYQLWKELDYKDKYNLEFNKSNMTIKIIDRT